MSDRAVFPLVPGRSSQIRLRRVCLVQNAYLCQLAQTSRIIRDRLDVLVSHPISNLDHHLAVSAVTGAKEMELLFNIRSELAAEAWILGGDTSTIRQVTCCTGGDVFLRDP